MKHFALLPALAILAACATPQEQCINTNLLQNGSFEADDLGGAWGLTQNLSGWSILGDAAEVWKSGQVTAENTASDGDQHLELDANAGSIDGIFQDVETSQGEVYNLSLDLAQRAGTDASSNTVEILWNGEVVAEVDPTSTDFKTFIFKVEGTGGADRLTIREDGADDNSYGGLVDNVSLVSESDTSYDRINGGAGSDSISGNQYSCLSCTVYGLVQKTEIKGAKFERSDLEEMK